VPANGYFRLGSNTKTYVSVVLLQLVGEGRLSLEDPVRRWLPVTRG
jgi:D-alanyl-D-alanine carboxypeptidase